MAWGVWSNLDGKIQTEWYTGTCECATSAVEGAPLPTVAHFLSAAILNCRLVKGT